MNQLRIVLRTLARHRGFTIVAVLSLAVAVALNTTMYSVLDAMLVPRVEARKPENIYSIRYYGDYRRVLPAEAIEDALRAGFKSYEGLSGLRWSVAFGMEPLIEYGSRYYRARMSAAWPIVTVRLDYFDFLGTRALQGRTFVAGDESGQNVVISDRLADKLFADESPIGRALTIEGAPFTVVGVIARSPVFPPLTADVWMTRRLAEPPVPVTFVRFRDDVEHADVERELAVISARLALAANESPRDTRFYAKRFVIERFKVQNFHLALSGAVIAVLLVACANLASLQLARGLARSRELALRSAVGASRGQLVAQLVFESGVLALSGLILGVIITLWGVGLLKSSMPPTLGNYMVEPQISWRVFSFAAVATLVCLFLVGLLPALRVSRVDPDTLLKSGAGTGANREHRRRYGLMVVAQVGLALPVLIGAILALRSALQLHDRHYFARQVYGYDAFPIVVANVMPPLPVGGGTRLADVAAELSSLARSVPGVLEAAVHTSAQPVGRQVTVDGLDGSVREMMAHQWSYARVSSGYFRTIGRAIERGRDFVEGELDGESVIVDAPTARFLWGGEDPIGRSIKLGTAHSNARWHRVVGVVGDQRDTFAIRRRMPDANYRLYGVYRAIAASDSFVARWTGNSVAQQRGNSLTLYARARGSSELAAVRLQRALRGYTAAMPPTVTPLVDRMGLTYWREEQRFVAWLFGVFAALGVSLVAIGVYGIVAHSVAERRRELAVRMSLGANARDILRSVLREGNVLVLAGVAVGLLFVKQTVWWLSNFMIENDGYHAILFAVIAMILFAIATVAAFIPAWRATHIDPVEALRQD